MNRVETCMHNKCLGSYGIQFLHTLCKAEFFKKGSPFIFFNEFLVSK